MTCPNVPPTVRDVACGSSSRRSSAARCTTSPEIHGRELHLLGPGEVEKVGDDLAERLGFLADPFDVGLILRRECLRVDQAAVAMNRGEAVAELMGDAGGQLPSRASVSFRRSCCSSSTTAVRSEKRQMTPRGAVAFHRAGRNADAEVHVVPCPGLLDGSPQDRTAGAEAFLDDLHERRNRGQHVVVIDRRPHCPSHPSIATAGRIEDLDAAGC